MLMADLAAVALLFAFLTVFAVLSFAAWALRQAREMYAERMDQMDRVAGGYVAVAEGAARAVGEAVAAATGPVAAAAPPALFDPLVGLEDERGIDPDEDLDWTLPYLPERHVSGASVGLRMPDGTVAPEMTGEEWVADDGWDGPT